MHMANQKILTYEAETPHPLLLVLPLYVEYHGTLSGLQAMPIMFSNAPDPQTHMMR